MPDWIRRTALADLLATDFAALTDEALYRQLDRLHPQRVTIERALAERERTLLNLDDTLYIYDLTLTYFEGQCRRNPQARRGYLRDQRPDCKQVVIGLVLDRDGFPKAHEVFDGNRPDRTTLDAMLQTLEQRTGRPGGATVVVDRGMAFADNLQQILRLDGAYVLETDRQDLTADETWRLYILCMLAYHLLVAIGRLPLWRDPRRCVRTTARPDPLDLDGASWARRPPRLAAAGRRGWLACRLPCPGEGPNHAQIPYSCGPVARTQKNLRTDMNSV